MKLFFKIYIKNNTLIQPYFFIESEMIFLNEFVIFFKKFFSRNIMIITKYININDCVKDFERYIIFNSSNLFINFQEAVN